METRGYNSITSWVAAVCCAIIAFLLLVPMRLAGMLFVIIHDRYHTDRDYATVPIVVFGMLRTITGPFTGYLGEVFGLQTITFIGCALASIGIGSCFFAEEINTVIVCLGFIYGMGLAFGTTLITAILSQHFNTNINFVNGVYLTGSCLGAVVMSPVIQRLMDVYGVSGMFLILSGILLHCIPAVMLLKDPKNAERALKAERKRRITLQLSSSSSNEKQVNSCPQNFAFIPDLETSYQTNTEKGIYTIEKLNYSKDKSALPANIPVVCVSKNPPGDAFGNKSQAMNLYAPIKTNSENFFKFNMETKQKVMTHHKGVQLISYTGNYTFPYGHESLVNPAPFGDVARSQAVACELKNDIIHFRNPSIVTILQPSKHSKSKDTLRTFRLFRDPTFHLTMVVQSAHAFVTTMNWTVLVDYARDKGITTHLSIFFVMFLPVAEIFGNLTLSWITDRGYMTRTNFCMACYLILGLDGAFIVWTQDFASMMIGVLIFGYVSGALQTTFPGIIIEFFEEELQNMALASRYILYAFLCLTKSPIVGYFRDELGSYNCVYYIIIAFCVASGILVKFTPMVATCSQKRRLNAENKRRLGCQ